MRDIDLDCAISARGYGRFFHLADMLRGWQKMGLVLVSETAE
jgi:hypothetical protein